MAGNFKDKIALVTGGACGLGRETAVAFAREGAKVVVADILADEGEETVQLIKGMGSDGFFVRTDVSRREDVEQLVQRTIDTYGRIDCALNNVGVGVRTLAPTHEVDEAEWDRVMDINVKGVWYCMKYQIPHMLRQGGGAIINMSSASGVHGTPRQAAYSTSKHAVLGLTKSAALEYGRLGIRINAVCPGPIMTPGTAGYFERDPQAREKLEAGTPMGRVGEPREIAETVLWLASDGASYITGQSILVDGGRSVV